MIRRVSSTTVRPTLDRPRAAQSGRGRLEDAELRRPRLGLLEQLGVGQGDGGVRRERRDEGDVAAGPVARLVGHGRERPDDPVVVDERRDRGRPRRSGRRRTARSRGGRRPDVREREDPAGPQDLADPALVAVEDGQPAATSSGSPAQAATSSRSSCRMRIVVTSARRRATGLVDDRPEELLAVVRRRQTFGDAEDRVQPLGELDLERAGVGTLVDADRDSTAAIRAEEPTKQRWTGARRGTIVRGTPDTAGLARSPTG